MADVCNRLGLKDNRSAKKWLHDNNVPISIIGGRAVVSQFAFKLKRQQLLVEQLMISYPNKWFEIYDAHTSDKDMVKSIRELYPEVRGSKKSSTSKTKKYIE